jgi:ATP-dependent helicase/DNAse subunit B
MIHFSYSRFQQEQPVLPSFFLSELDRISDKPLQTKHGLNIFTPAGLMNKLLGQRQNPAVDFQKSHIPDFIGDFLTPQMIQHFDHSQQITRHREQLSAPSEWEGNLAKDQMTVNWLLHCYQNEPFSPTQLERYAKCPMIYFLNRILGLQPFEEGDEFVTALDRGSILHQILFHFYRKTNPEKRQLASLISIGQEYLERVKIAESLLWELEREYFLGNELRMGLLPTFWEYEQRMMSFYKTIPKHFELSVGKVSENPDNIDPFSSAQPFLFQRDEEKYFFSGKIDRVEIAENGALLVADYKSGVLPSFQDIWKGERLQLPIYLKMVFQLLRRLSIFPMTNFYMSSNP